MRINALATGIVAAFLAVMAQGYFFLHPPQAYGICVICHGRDLINWLINYFFNQQLPLTVVARNIPLLTVLGILVGASIGAYQNKEWKAQWIEERYTSFFTGLIVMISGLIISACPMRLLLRTAYGDLVALAGAIALVIGVIFGTLYLKRRAEKHDTGDF